MPRQPATTDRPGPAEIALRMSKIVAMALAEHDLTDNQFRVLRFVDAGAPGLREMSARLVMKQSNLSQLIQGLVRRELITRNRHSDDARKFELRLTARGRKVLRSATSNADDAIRGLARVGRGQAAVRLAGLKSWEPAVVEAARLVRKADR